MEEAKLFQAFYVNQFSKCSLSAYHIPGTVQGFEYAEGGAEDAVLLLKVLPRWGYMLL